MSLLLLYTTSWEARLPDGSKMKKIHDASIHEASNFVDVSDSSSLIRTKSMKYTGVKVINVDVEGNQAEGNHTADDNERAGPQSDLFA